MSFRGNVNTFYYAWAQNMKVGASFYILPPLQQSFLISHLLKVQAFTDWVESSELTLQTLDC